ncbi:hypothetical protein MNBD_NITROSPINAE01-578 [hydrothermal vent metagenome]|uniref:Uncharacterized protein n=1 Tax=hydrothermal vent metagenome TaxID=652676 RepID=A0A3B1BFP4_9ZZZZ
MPNSWVWARPFVATLIILTITACSRAETSHEDIAKKIVKNTLGSAATGKITVTPDGISVPLKSGSVDMKVTPKSDTAENTDKKSFFPPKAQEISRINGIRNGAIYNIRVIANVEETGRMFMSHLKKNGYKKINSYLLDGMFSGNWIKKTTQTKVRIYAYPKEAETRVALAVSKIAKVGEKGAM